jgi:hypothetical protein
MAVPDETTDAGLDAAFGRHRRGCGRMRETGLRAAVLAEYSRLACGCYISPAHSLDRHLGFCTRLGDLVIAGERGVLFGELKNDVSGRHLGRPRTFGEGRCTGPGSTGLCGGRPVGSGKIQAGVERSASPPMAAPPTSASVARDHQLVRSR